MKYAVLFGIASVFLVGIGLQMGVVGSFLVWLGVDFAIVGAGYGGLGARVLGKQTDGTITPLSLCLLFPFFLLTWTVWHIGRRMSRVPAYHQITSDLWWGRRVLAGELPETISLVVDLTAEFAEPKAIRTGRTYLCVPTLDASVPSLVALQHLVETIATWQGSVYIHCAAGYGRSAMVAVAVLLVRGWESDRIGAEARLRNIRPGVRLNNLQRRAIDRLYPPHTN